MHVAESVSFIQKKLIYQKLFELPARICFLSRCIRCEYHRSAQVIRVLKPSEGWAGRYHLGDTRFPGWSATLVERP